ncbi:MAG TPA: hypothetical protein VE422_40555 [Terriglobia bacterium]|nr:hypothetical protein [Terriglobia bacterium]
MELVGRRGQQNQQAGPHFRVQDTTSFMPERPVSQKGKDEIYRHMRELSNHSMADIKLVRG